MSEKRMNKSISIIIDRLNSSGYKQVQYIPMHKLRWRPGRELLILQSFLKKHKTILYKGSILQPLYQKIMFAIYPALLPLYKLFLKGQEIDQETILKTFDKQKIEILTNDKLLFFTNNSGYSSNYRIVPIDEKFIVCSPSFEFDTADYVYLGEDSVVFKDLLKEKIKENFNRALEIGCGTGFISLSISGFAKDVTAVDINPRALEFANLNAEINHVSNVTTQISNVYSNVQGKFDLIISNPPYVFLPNEHVNRTFAFGGILGLEILEKILLGLDEHLNEKGCCYLIFFSYIKNNGTDTALELINNIFNNKPYELTLQQIDYHPLKSHPSFYAEHKISHAIRYFVKIQKSTHHNLTHLKIKGIRKILERLKIKF